MILPKREDSYHKVQLFRLLIKILDSPIAKDIYFKGGSAAALLRVVTGAEHVC